MNEYIVHMIPQEDKIFEVQLCGITYPDQTYRIERSNAPIYVLEYIMDGEGTVAVNGEQYHVKGGDIYILKQGESHLYYSDSENPWTKIWVNLFGMLISNLISIYGLDDITVIHGLSIQDEMNKMLEICESGENINVRCEIVFHEIMRKIHDYLHTSGENISKEARTIKEYINSNIAENITIKDLSRQIFRSEAQTIRIFKAAYQMTPYEYILSGRLKSAKLLLLNTNLFIKEIAYNTGFSDGHYFANIFKKKTGFSPKEYRKMYK